MFGQVDPATLSTELQRLMTSPQDSSAKERKVNKDLGKDDFLLLLTTQLRHQDPLEPMKNENFVAQLAQFSSLEQMQNVSESQAKATHVAMIGKFVVGWDKKSSLEITGMVTGVVFQGSEPKLLIQTQADDPSAISVLLFEDVEEVMNTMPEVPDSTGGN